MQPLPPAPSEPDEGTRLNQPLCPPKSSRHRGQRTTPNYPKISWHSSPSADQMPASESPPDAHQEYATAQSAPPPATRPRTSHPASVQQSAFQSMTPAPRGDPQTRRESQLCQHLLLTQTNANLIFHNLQR